MDPGMMAYPPNIEIKRFIVTTSAETDSLTPKAGKRIHVIGHTTSQVVGSKVTATVKATLAFGRDGADVPDKILDSNNQIHLSSHTSSHVDDVNILGDVDEIIQLKNTTFSSGSVTTRATIYYLEE